MASVASRKPFISIQCLKPSFASSMSHGGRAGDLEADTCALQLQVVLDETRGGIQSEGRKIDRSLHGMLKLAEECATVNVDAELVGRHRRSFTVAPWDFSTLRAATGTDVAVVYTPRHRYACRSVARGAHPPLRSR